ncbi:MAG: carboxypeptidase-like regulatory domain-containing protein [Ferruginibacter sp.]|nr:carboxypeptidase-like regulatory domain-containing protein [Ferruginibacter sp.]
MFPKKSFVFRCVFLCFVVCCSSLFSMNVLAQKIYGVIRNEKGEVVPYASVIVKGTSRGVSANGNAEYALTLTSGNNVIVCQHVGYESFEKELDISADTKIDLILKEQQLMMKEVVIKKGEDPAYEIIRNAIRKRDDYKKEVKSFSCDYYGKDIIRINNLPKQLFGQKITTEDIKVLGLDSSGKGIAYLSESFSKVFSEQPDKFKLEVMSSRVSGSNRFGFTFPTFISLYDNNVKIFTEQLNPRGFVSPIADRAMNFYRFKFKGSFLEDGKLVNSIQVIPKRAYEPLFSGTINIIEDDWRIQSFNLLLTKKSQLEILDSLHISQLHVPASKEVWLVKNQLIHFNFNFMKFDVGGNFLSVYSDYAINPVFHKNTFGNVVIRYDTAVDKKSKKYWEEKRPVPLDDEEMSDYRVKDSLFELTQAPDYWKNNIDSLKKRQGALKPSDLFFTGVNRTHYSNANRFKWGFDPLIACFSFNTAEGVLMQMSGYFDKKFEKSNSRLIISPTFRYGFGNTHLNSWVDIVYRRREPGYGDAYERSTWSVSGGKRISQYNKDIPITPLVNMISTLQRGLNAMKTYENYFLDLGYSGKYENGLSIKAHVLYEDRSPIFNTNNYTLFQKNRSRITENYPVERVSIADIFKHQAAMAKVELSYKPGQKYIQFPDNKIALTSDYPTFSLSYSKGFEGILGSDVNFDKWVFGIRDDENLKLAGTLKYKINIGGFLNNKKVLIQDYQHFNANPLTSASEYVNSFQLTNSYSNSTTEKFYALAHVEHHFNGLLTNKIPIFKQLKWNLVIGSNAFFINRNRHFAEAFIGIENIFRLFRLDYVHSYHNGKFASSALVLGAGNILGGSTTNFPPQGRLTSVVF